MRGIRNDYDPYRIIFNRLEQYIVMGQNPDKVDQIIMGGTFTSFPKKYQQEYIYYSFKAYNDFSKIFYPNGDLDIEEFKLFFELPGDIYNDDRKERIKAKILEIKYKDIQALEEEQKDNENSAIRCIGLTIETRPDWANSDIGKELLDLGVTRIELGVQTIYDDIYAEAENIADYRNCFTEGDMVSLEDPEKSWQLQYFSVYYIGCCLMAPK